MFMVINKDKIVSYLISLSTVAILFVVSFVYSNQNDKILESSTNVIQEENIVNFVENDGNVTKMLQK